MINQQKINKILRKCYELKSSIRSINITINSMKTKHDEKVESLRKRQLGMSDKMDKLITDIREIDPLN